MSEDGLAALQALIDRSVRTATPAVADSVAYPERQMTAAELVDFVRQARMIAMATVGPTGQPHIAPVHAEVDGTTLRLVVYENTVRRQDIVKNPRVGFTTWKDGAEQSKSEMTLDANGLPATNAATMTMRRGPNAGKPMTQESAYTWTKSGDSWRLDKIEGSNQMGKTAIEITYSDMGGYSFPTSWKATNPMGTMEVRVTDLTIDGKKCELAKPEPAKVPAEPKKDKDGDDDEKNEGKEKK